MAIERESNEGQGRPVARGGVPTVRIPEAWEARFAGARIGGHAAILVFGSPKRSAFLRGLSFVVGLFGCWQEVWGPPPPLTEPPHTSVRVPSTQGPVPSSRSSRECRQNAADVRCTQSLKDL
jgi:hypothetical protein